LPPRPKWEKELMVVVTKEDKKKNNNRIW